MEYGFNNNEQLGMLRLTAVGMDVIGRLVVGKRRTNGYSVPQLKSKVVMTLLNFRQGYKSRHQDNVEESHHRERLCI